MSLTPSSGHADHGPHVLCAEPGAQEISWHTVPQARVRVLLWTCECRVPQYLLASAGGQLLIVREDGRGTAYSPRMSYRDGEELWADLLAGRAH